MSVSARRPLLGALLALCAFAPGAVAADVGTVELKSAYVGPVAVPTATNSSPCTAEPRSAIYSNLTFDPTKAPLRSEDANRNAPSILDVAPDLKAGAHSDLCVGYAATPNMDPDATDRPQSVPPTPDLLASHVDPTIVSGEPVPGSGDDAKRIAIDLPPGYLGEPDRTPQCTDAQFRIHLYIGMTCPVDTRIGDGDVYLQANIGTAASPTQVSLSIPGTQNGQTVRVVNLTHSPNELGRLGVQVNSSITQPVKFTVRLLLAGADRHVQAVVEDVPKIAYGGGSVFLPGDDDWTEQNSGTLRPDATTVGLYVESVSLRIFGSKAAHPAMARDFGELGTDCSGDQTSTLSMRTVLGTESQLATNAGKLTDCDELAFDPSVQVTTTERRPARPTGATVKVGFEQSTGPRVSALPRQLNVTLPAGLEVGAQVASGTSGLPLCTAAQFGASAPGAASNCPAASAAADVEIVSPLVTLPFIGKAYLGEQGAVGELPDLYLDVATQGATAADAPRVKLIGDVTVSDQGQLTASFRDVPQLRFSEVTLDFPEGPNALFVTPRACGVTQGISAVTAWSGATRAPASSLTIDQDCDESGSTSLELVPSNAAAGVKAPLAVKLARSSDRAPWLSGVKVALPPGQLADLTAATECAPAAAAAASCPDSSRIATVTVKAGVGEDPIDLTGAMFLTERESGHAAGGSIVVRAKLGDLDLGDVIVPAVIDLRPTDAGLTLTTLVPERFRGLALNVREVEVDLDRENFALNPSACGPLPATATLTPAAGTTVDVSTQVAYTGCAERPFAPSITAEAIGENVAGGHPTLKFEIRTRPGDSNLKSTSVRLPLGLSTDLRNVQNRCLPAAFEAAACESAHRVGSVVALASITSEQVPGDVYLVDVPGETLPGLGLNFTGRFAQRVSSTVRFVGDRVQATFPAIPDLPLTKLSLTLDGGARSPILRSVRCSAANSSWDSAFIGQGGQGHTTSQPTPCQGAPAVVKPEPKRATVKLSASRKTGLKLTVRDLGDRKLQSLKLSAPKGKSFVTSALKKKNRATATLTGAGKAKLKLTRASVNAQITGKTGASSASLRLDRRGSVVTSGKRPKKGTKVSFKLRLAFTDGTSETKTIRVTAPR